MMSFELVKEMETYVKFLELQHFQLRSLLEKGISNHLNLF